MTGTKPLVTDLVLTYSTHLGGSGEGDVGDGIVVDAAGNAYVTGPAFTNFPTTPGAFATTLNGSFNVFVTKLNATGPALIFST